MAERPFGITLLSLIFVLIGIYSIIIIVLPFFPLSLKLKEMAIALVSFSLAWGLWNGKAWSWWAMVITGIISMFISIIIHFLVFFRLFIPSLGFLSRELGYNSLFSSIVISYLLVWYFLTDHVMKYFNLENSYITQIIRSIKIP